MDDFLLKPLITIVDDDSDIRDIIKGTLNNVSDNIIELSSGEAAIEWLQSNEPDLIILDLMMPGISGVEVCKIFKSSSKNASLIPILMLTASDDIKNLVSALDSGADDFLTKPFRYQELQARARALLRLRQLHLGLEKANRDLKEAQDLLLANARQALLGEITGAAAHELGQPISALLLNCHLLEKLCEYPSIAADKEPSDRSKVIYAMKQDANKMKEIVEKLQKANASELMQYHKDLNIIKI